MYLDDAPETFDRMRRNLEEENWTDLAINAHSLKPKSDFMGIAGLKEILIQIEDGVKHGKYAGLKTLYEKALEIHKEACTVLRKEVVA